MIRFVVVGFITNQWLLCLKVILLEIIVIKGVRVTLGNLLRRSEKSGALWEMICGVALSVCRVSGGRLKRIYMEPSDKVAWSR